MRIYPIRLQPKGEYGELVGVSDLHYGSSGFLESKAFEHREYILDNRDRYVVDLGDSTENALRTSPGASIFHQTCPPREQREWVKEYYRPVKNRVLAVVASNHSYRSEREADISPDEPLVSFLDCEYIKWDGILAITVGNASCGQQYLIYVRHAISNSAKKQTILTSMFNQSRLVQGCDAYWFAHCHQYIAEPQPCLTPDPRHGKIRKFEQWFLMGDSFLDYDMSYADLHNYGPPAEGQISLKLYKKQRKLEVVRLVY